jgi:DNA polymerase epsilon subunit 2
MARVQACSLLFSSKKSGRIKRSKAIKSTMNSTATDRKRTTRIFKSRGLTIQSSALDALLNVLSREANNNSDEALSAIISEIKLRNAKVVNLSLLEEVVAELSRNGRDVTEEALQLLNAYAMPRLEYDSMRRTFSLIQSKKSLIGEASDKVDMFAQRYSLIHQRILRQDIFQPKLVGGGGGTHVLTPVESLLGRSGRKFLLGMIVQVRLFV